MARVIDFTDLAGPAVSIVRLAGNPALIEDCARLALCAEDIRELQVTHGNSDEALREAVLTPGAHAVLLEGTPCGVFGVHGHIIWALSDGRLRRKRPGELWRISRGVLARCRELCHYTYNVTLADSKNLAYLIRLGFVFHKPYPVPGGVLVRFSDRRFDNV